MNIHRLQIICLLTTIQMLILGTYAILTTPNKKLGIVVAISVSVMALCSVITLLSDPHRSKHERKKG